MRNIVKLPWAPSANQIWRNHRAGQVYLSPKYQDFLKLAYYEWAEQGAPKFNGESAQVIINLYPPSARPYDVDNRIKPTLDALTKIGFWKDDRIVRKVTAIANAPVERGAIIVEVDTFEDEQNEQASNERLCRLGLRKITKDGKRKKKSQDNPK